MIQFIIPLLKAWIPIWNIYLIDIFCLGFLAFVGCFIHRILRR